MLGDPAFYRSLVLPDLRLLEAVPGRDEPTGPRGAGVVRSSGAVPSRAMSVVVRYEFTGSLDPVVRRLLGGARLTWSQEVRVTREGGTLSFSAERDPRVLHGGAEFTLEPLGPGDGGTTRRLAGHVTVSLPLVGALAERRIVAGIVARLDLEAEGVRRALGRPGAPGAPARRGAAGTRPPPRAGG